MCSRIGISVSKPWEAIMWRCENEVQALVWTPGCWRCLNCGSLPKGSCKTGVEPAQDRSCVCCKWPSWRAGTTKALWSPDEHQMLDIELQDLVFALLGVGLFFGLIFPCRTPHSSFWEWGCLFFAIVCWNFVSCWFYRSLQVRDCLESQIRLWTV